jgi:hypothetical protein
MLPFSEMLQSAALVTTDVSEERSASITRVTRIGELGIKFAITNNQRTLRSTTARQRHIPEDGILLSHRSESLKSYTASTGWAL